MSALQFERVGLVYTSRVREIVREGLRGCNAREEGERRAARVRVAGELVNDLPSNTFLAMPPFSVPMCVPDWCAYEAVVDVNGEKVRSAVFAASPSDAARLVCCAYRVDRVHLIGLAAGDGAPPEFERGTFDRRGVLQDVRWLGPQTAIYTPEPESQARAADRYDGGLDPRSSVVNDII